MQNKTNNSTDRKAYIITGPTSGIGRAAAFEVAKQGTAILLGSSLAKLREVQTAIEQRAREVTRNARQPLHLCGGERSG